MIFGSLHKCGAVLATLALMSMTQVHGADSSQAADVSVAPLLGSEDANAGPNSYIVVFKNEASAQDVKEHRDWVQKIHLEEQSALPYSGEAQESLPGLRNVFNIGCDDDSPVSYSSASPSLRAYTGAFGPQTLAKIRESAVVSYVERRQTFEVARAIETDAPWGLGRLSHREYPSFHNVGQVNRSATSGAGVLVYVLDTGVFLEHEQFEGRAFASDFKTFKSGDKDGHGSHVAGTIAGKTFGVANKATIIEVKVLNDNGKGENDSVEKGIEFVIEDVKRRLEEAKKPGAAPFKGAVINMSLGGPASRFSDETVAMATSQGIHVVVAAGNEDQEACNKSPAREETAVTVMSSTFNDELAIHSNFGKCADIAAPGLLIKSVGLGSPTATLTISGTSMAAPHVAGVVADLLSQSKSKEWITPAQMKDILVKLATKDALAIPRVKLTKKNDEGKIVNLKTPNLLVFNGDLPALEDL